MTSKKAEKEHKRATNIPPELTVLSTLKFFVLILL
jgi:hypothetical protein